MVNTKMLYAWLAGAVGIIVLGVLWHRVIMGGFYDEQGAAIMREEPQMLFVILALLILAFLMAYAYPIGYKGGSPITEGLKFGALIGLVAFLPFNLIIHGIFNYPLAGALVDAGWHVVEEGVGGVIIALVYGSGAAPEQS